MTGLVQAALRICVLRVSEVQSIIRLLRSHQRSLCFHSISQYGRPGGTPNRSTAFLGIPNCISPSGPLAVSSEDSPSCVLHPSHTLNTPQVVIRTVVIRARSKRGKGVWTGTARASAGIFTSLEGFNGEHEVTVGCPNLHRDILFGPRHSPGFSRR